MRLLEDKILKEGKILGGDILKVDCFLNHQIDVNFLNLLGKEIYNHYQNCGINKILTVEASGIALACLTAQFFNCKLLIAKKHKSLNLSDDVYFSKVFSFTHKTENTIMVSKEYLSPSDNVLVIDDFLANGNASNGLIEIIEKAGATLKGVSVAIEKGFQGGGDALRNKGIDVFSLAIIDEMKNGKLTFRK